MIKALVTLVIAMELGHLVGTTQGVWAMTIGTLEALMHPTATSSSAFSVGSNVAAILGVPIAFFTRLFFLYRFRRFSRAWIFPSLCGLLSLAHLVLGLLVWSRTVGATNPQGFREQNAILIEAVLAIELVADTFVTGGIAYYLWDSGRSVLKTSKASKTIRQLTLWTVEAGLATTITDLVIVITFVTMPSNFLWTGIYTFQPSIYVNSLLAALNGRKRLQRDRTPAHINTDSLRNLTTFTPNMGDGSYGAGSDTFMTDSDGRVLSRTISAKEAGSSMV